MNTYHNALPSHGERHPLTAAFLSIVPGLGQLYVGDNRKGILFLDVALLNYVLLAIVCFSVPIAKAINQFAFQYKFAVNIELVGALMSLRIGSPSFLFLIALMVLFVSFAARDAYDKAFGLRRKKIYGDSIIDLSEATSGSYLGHIAMMMSCLLLALLFVHPPAPPRQITEIEVELDQKVQAVKPPVTKTISTRDVTHQGKRRHDMPTKVAQAATSTAKSATPSKPVEEKPASSAPPALKPEPVKQEQPKMAAAPQPLPAVAPMPVKLAMAAPPLPRPLPSPRPMQTASPTAVLPTPKVEIAKSMAAVSPLSPVLPTEVRQAPGLPMPANALPHSRFVTPKFEPATFYPPAQRMGGTISTLPSMSTGTASSSPLPGGLPSKIFGVNTAGGPSVPGPRAISDGSSSATAAPNVVAVKSPTAGAVSRGCAGCGGTSGHGPAPVKSASFSNSDGGTFAVAPTFHLGGPGHDTGSEDHANPNIDGKDGPVRVDTRKEEGPDFSLYMAELQRRIKKAWFPPRGTENLRAVMMFSVHEEGGLSNLRIVHSSGVQAYDQMALKAVESAAPFKHLPPKAPQSVDIEFTFDFNVFKN